jgi:hypothetical protein
MKTISLFLRSALLLSATLASCATSGYHKAETTATALESMRSDLRGVGDDLLSLHNSLKGVLNASSDGTIAAFQNYRSELQNLQRRFSAAEADFQDVKGRGKSYFESWQKEIASIQDEEIRNSAIARRDTLLRAQDDLEHAMDTVRPEYQTLLHTLEDLRIYFSNDLSSAGIELARAPVDRIGTGIASLRTRLDDVVAVIDGASPGFTPAVTVAATVN